MVKQNKKMNMIHLLITKLGKGESIPARFQPHRLKGGWEKLFRMPYPTRLAFDLERR